MSKKRFLSLLIAMMMMLSVLVPANLIAAEGDDDDIIVTVEPDADPVVTEDEGGDPAVTEDEGGDPAVTEDEGGDPVVTDDEGGDPAVTEDEGGDPVVTEDEGGDPAVTDDEGGDPVVTEDEGGDPVVTDDEGGDPVVTEDEGGDPVVTEDEGGDPAAVEGDPVEEEETPAVFTRGYVRVQGDTVAYKSADKSEKAGQFGASSVVYARMALQAENLEDSWLRVTFDTAASAGDENALSAYVQLKNVAVLSEEESEAYVSGRTDLRVIDDIAIPVASFTPEEPAVIAPPMRTVASVSVSANKERATDGETVILTATPNNTTGNLTYKWQKSTTGTGSWGSTTMSGYNTASMTFTVTESKLSYYYRCRVTDDNGTWYSAAIKVTYYVKPTVTVSANRTEATDGDSVALSAVISGGSGTVTYKWQKSSTGTGSWGSTTMSGYNTATMTFSANKSKLSYFYRCRVTDENGTWYSDPIKVNYVEPAVDPTITASANVAMAGEGETVILTAVASDTVGTLTYKWQKSADGATNWGSTTMSGYNTDTMTFEASDTKLSYYYRCRVIDANGTWYSNPVKVAPKPAVKAKANKAGVVKNAQVVLTATVTNTSGTLTYKWQKSSDGKSNWGSTTLTGYDTSEMSFTATEARLASYYRCRVTDDKGTWYSNVIKVELLPTPHVTAVSDKDSARAGETVVLTATAADTSGKVTYKWQKSATGTTGWSSTTLSGYNTDTLTISVTEARLNSYYRCRVTDASGNWYSNVIKVEYDNSIVITNDDGQFVYKKLTNTTCALVSYTGSATYLTIPETVQGMTVTEIGKEAFMDNTVLVSIDLPNTITAIRARAFKGCTNLSDMH